MAEHRRALGEKAARQLSNTTKTPPQWRGATPRWLTQMLPWTPVEAGVYRPNQALDDDFAVKCSPEPGEALPVALSDYDAQPREYVLFTADVPHSYVNPGNEECWMYLVMTYASRPKSQ